MRSRSPRHAKLAESVSLNMPVEDTSESWKNYEKFDEKNYSLWKCFLEVCAPRLQNPKIEKFRQGRFGNTYASTLGDTTIVIKEFFLNTDATKRDIINEIKFLKYLSNSGISCNYLGHTINNETRKAYIAMEYIEGTTVQAFLNGISETCKTEAGKATIVARGESFFKDLYNNIKAVLKGLAAKGVCHNDMNKDNIIRKKDGSVILIDFAFSKKIGESTVTNPISSRPNISIASRSTSNETDKDSIILKGIAKDILSKFGLLPYSNFAVHTSASDQFALYATAYWIQQTAKLVFPGFDLLTEAKSYLDTNIHAIASGTPVASPAGGYRKSRRRKAKLTRRRRRRTHRR